MSLRQKAVKGVFWSAIQKWGSQLISTGVFLLLARLLGAEAFGLVALASVYISFMSLFIDQGFSQAIVQRKDLTKEHLDTAFWTSLIISFFLTVCSIGLSGFIASFFDEPQLSKILSFLSVNFLISGLRSVQSALITRNLQFRILAFRSLLATAVSGTLGVALAFLGYGVWSLVWKEIVFNIVGLFLLWFASDWRPSFKLSVKHFKELFLFGINIAGFNLLTFLNRRSDNLLIGFYLGSTVLGYYTVAYRLFEIVNQVITNTMGQIALPIFSRMQEDRNKLRRAFYTGTQFSSILAVPSFIGITIFSPEIVNLSLGADWQASIPVIRILTFIGIIQAIYYFNGTVLVSMGKPNWRLLIYLVNTAVNLISFLIVVRWGIVAVASAFVLRSYILSPIPLLALKKLISIDIRIYINKITPSLVATGLMALILIPLKVFMADSEPSIILATGIPLGILSYVTTIYVFYREIADKIFLIFESFLLKAKAKNT